MNKLYDIIGIPFGYLMSFIYNIIGNYGVAIVLFTIVTKLILFPVNYKTQKNAARMRLLTPKIEKLRKSYSNNPTKLQEEQQKLYQQEGLNPMASCMPSLIQMLLLFGVIDVVYKPLTHILRLKNAVITKFVEIASPLTEKGITTKQLNCELLSMEQLKIDENAGKFSELGGDVVEKIEEFSSNFTFLGADLGKTPQFSPDVWNMENAVLFLIPIFAGLAQLLYSVYSQIHQKKTNPGAPNMGCMSVMMYLMPLLSVWFAYQVPAGVGFYWIWSSVFSFMITLGLNIYFNDERIVVINEKEKEKARIYAEKHPEKKTFMQKMLEQQQAAEQQSRYNSDGEKISRAEMNKQNRDRINEARRRMAEKYGDVYDENNDED